MIFWLWCQNEGNGSDVFALIRSSRCQNGGTCVNTSGSDSRSSCLCPAGFTGPSCELHISKLKHRPRVKASAPVHARPETETESDPLVIRSQIICFAVLGLLTCLVILGTTGIVFFNRCETWMANAKYSQLVRQQRASDREQHSLNIILPSIKLSNYGKHYTSIWSWCVTERFRALVKEKMQYAMVFIVGIHAYIHRTHGEIHGFQLSLAAISAEFSDCDYWLVHDLKLDEPRRVTIQELLLIFMFSSLVNKWLM